MIVAPQRRTKKATAGRRREHDYERRKERARKTQAAMSAGGRDIGPPSPVVDQARKDDCRNNFKLYCETYYPEAFNMAWSEDHIRVANRIERVILKGGLFAMAMPRGSGKTTLCTAGCSFAAVYGHRRFPVVIGSDEQSAIEILNSLKVDLESNELLHEDFPEVCFPIRCLDRIANRCAGQTCHGIPTRIRWTEKEIVLPTMSDSPASGVIVKVAGITGRVRGMQHKLADGSVIRPDLVLPDDPQTDESARSPSQCATRENTLAGAILGLAGPGKKIAGLMPCTVIRKGDMADNILDRKKHPEWHGERCKMVYSFPDREDLWEQYTTILREDQEQGGEGDPATKFYKKNRKAMDKGARVGWEARHFPEELSALQHAMNLKIRDEAAFWAEYQNEPMDSVSVDDRLPGVDELALRCTSLPRGTVPMGSTKITAFIDVQGTLLYWVVCAWSDNFTGAVIDYGAWPDQGVSYFTLASAKRTMAMEMPGAGPEGYTYHALTKLCAQILGREWVREDGVAMRIDRTMIDSGWGPLTETVYQFCRQSEFAPILRPSKGESITANKMPISEFPKSRGLIGHEWYEPAANRKKRAVRLCIHDTNAWSTFAFDRLAVPIGDRGALTIFKPDRRAGGHRMFFEQLLAEYRTRTEGRGRVVYVYQLKPGRPDNHMKDCLVGCAVGASAVGVSLEVGQYRNESARKPRKFKLSDLQNGKRHRSPR
ncbi:MAG: terminase gpA endonuclease subunit [Planctomycetota bacterium]